MWDHLINKNIKKMKEIKKDLRDGLVNLLIAIKAEVLTNNSSQNNLHLPITQSQASKTKAKFQQSSSTKISI